MYRWQYNSITTFNEESIFGSSESSKYRIWEEDAVYKQSIVEHWDYAVKVAVV